MDRRRDTGRDTHITPPLISQGGKKWHINTLLYGQRHE